jgi:hypothetical protein
VGSDGRLTGYGGGLWRKRRLLEHEGADGLLTLGLFLDGSADESEMLAEGVGG